MTWARESRPPPPRTSGAPSSAGPVPTPPGTGKAAPSRPPVGPGPQSRSGSPGRRGRERASPPRGRVRGHRAVQPAGTRGAGVWGGRGSSARRVPSAEGADRAPLAPSARPAGGGWAGPRAASPRVFPVPAPSSGPPGRRGQAAFSHFADGQERAARRAVLPLPVCRRSRWAGGFPSRGPVLPAAGIPATLPQGRPRRQGRGEPLGPSLVGGAGLGSGRGVASGIPQQRVCSRAFHTQTFPPKGKGGARGRGGAVGADPPHAWRRSLARCSSGCGLGRAPERPGGTVLPRQAGAPRRRPCLLTPA